MVGRQPSPLFPKRKKTVKKKTNSRPRQPIGYVEEEEAGPAVATERKKKAAKKPPVRRGIKPSAPLEQLSAEDKREMRRRRQRQRMILRLIIVVAVCALAVVVWLNWNVLAPNKVLAWLQDLVGGGTGSYPMDLSGTGAHRIVQNDRYTVVLTDSHILYLNSSGAEVARYHCGYSDPLLRTEGKYVLAAEQSGRRLLLTTRNKTVLSWEAERDIRTVSLNEKGQVAVLTTGPQGYAFRIQVYDHEGEVLYTRDSNRTVTDVALSPDGTTLSVTGVEAVDGTLNTRIEIYAVASSDPDPRCAYTATDMLLSRTAYVSEGVLAAVSEQGVVLMNTENGKTQAYLPEGMRVLGYAVSGDSVALAVRAYGDTAGGEVQVISSSGSVKSYARFEGEFRHLSGHEGMYVLLTDGTAQILSANGVGGKIAVAADSRQAVYTDGYVVIMGLNRLERFPIK